jgi:hypothetical protein
MTGPLEFPRKKFFDRRYETNSNIDQISIGSTNSDDSDKQLIECCGSTFNVHDTTTLLRQKSKSFDLDNGPVGMGFKSSVSRSTDCLYVNGATRNEGGAAYMNSSTMAIIQKRNKERSKSSSFGTSDDIAERTSEIILASNPVYIRTPTPHSMLEPEVSHHTLKIK